MAIKCDLELASGLKIKGAYVRIDNVNGHKGELTCTVNAYASEAAYRGKPDPVAPADHPKPAVEQTTLTFAPATGKGARDWLTQAYEQLKADPRYEGAVDVLDDAPEAREVTPRPGHNVDAAAARSQVLGQGRRS